MLLFFDGRDGQDHAGDDHDEAHQDGEDRSVKKLGLDSVLVQAFDIQQREQREQDQSRAASQRLEEHRQSSMLHQGIDADGSKEKATHHFLIAVEVIPQPSDRYPRKHLIAVDDDVFRPEDRKGEQEPAEQGGDRNADQEDLIPPAETLEGLDDPFRKEFFHRDLVSQGKVYNALWNTN